MTWDYLKRLRDLTKMKVVVKGLLAWEDAKLAADYGYDAIIVSNHGARADDSGRSTIDALPEIVEAVNGRMPILIDSGFRRGTDICKALCMGATGVASAGPICGASAPSARPASSACWNCCASSCSPSCSRSARHRSSTSLRPWCAGRNAREAQAGGGRRGGTALLAGGDRTAQTTVRPHRFAGITPA